MKFYLWLQPRRLHRQQSVGPHLKMRLAKPGAPFRLISFMAATGGRAYPGPTLFEEMGKGRLRLHARGRVVDEIFAQDPDQIGWDLGYCRRTRHPLRPFTHWRDTEFLNTGVRTSNDFAFHALAIDEHREKFAPALWTKTTRKDQPIRMRLRPARLRKSSNDGSPARTPMSAAAAPAICSRKFRSSG